MELDYTGARSHAMPRCYTTPISEEDEVAFYEKEIGKSLTESLNSTERSCQYLNNSEQLGIRTAHELLEQREQLERANRGLDQIEHTTKLAQRNINSLKSVFGGFFKNKFSEKTAVPGAIVSTSGDRLANTVESLSSDSVVSAFSSSEGSLNPSSKAALKGTRWDAMDSQIDENLSEFQS